MLDIVAPIDLYSVYRIPQRFMMTLIPSPSASTSGRAIAVADDSLPCATLLRDVLTWRGHRVTTFDSGADVKEALRTGEYAAAFIDVIMPSSGETLIRALRGDPAIQSVGLIAYTALAMLGDREILMGWGYDGYLCKPASIAQIDAALAHGLSCRLERAA